MITTTDEKTIESMSHDDVYVLDSNLVILYYENEDNSRMVGWRTFVNDHFALGKKLYLLPMMVGEVHLDKLGIEALHPNFHVLSIPPAAAKPEIALNLIFNKIADEFDLEPKVAEMLKIDIKLISYALYFVSAVACEYGEVSDDLTRGLFNTDLVLATNNFNTIRILLETDDMQQRFEQVLDMYGFEHLITVRHISDSNTWKDYF